ncbi:MAG: hypothetical protein FWE67_09255 [Planctomycetaceae bacterium]|nr:hypothetical protein [Planctomycetaceae bacterium]
MKKTYLLTLLTVFIFTSFVFVLETQAQRRAGRLVQRILGTVEDGTGYRVAPPSGQNSARQSGGEIAEGVLGIVQHFIDGKGGGTLKPVAIVSLASFDEFKQVALTVAKRIRESENSTEEPAMLNSFLSFYEMLVQNGFDTKQPLGFILQTDGLLYYPLFFTPMNLDNNFGKTFLERYTGTTADGSVILKTDIIPYPLATLHVRQYKGWLFIATERQLNSLPEDPTLYLEGLDKEKLLTARFYLDNVPRLTTGAALAFAEMQAVQTAQTEAEKASARLFISYLRALSEQANFLEYSLYYNAREGDYVIQQSEIVKPGTEQAKLLKERRNTVSPLHGLYYPENAAIAGHFCTYLTKAQRVNLEIILKETLGKHLLTEEEQAHISGNVASVEAEKSGAEPPVTAGDHRDKLANLLKLDGTDVNMGHREVLAELLALESAENAEYDSADSVPLQGLKLGGLPKQELSRQQKVETILKRIAACYYWGLLGSVRKGKFDTAFTVSQEHGILGGFVIEDKRFHKTLDEVFAEIAAQFPDVYQQIVSKNYKTFNGFKLTKISFRLSDILSESPLRFLFPAGNNDEKVTVILGVYEDMVCVSIGRGAAPEEELKAAILASEKALAVNDVFFVYSAYEAGQMFDAAGTPERFRPLRQFISNPHPEANAYADVEWTNTGKTVTLRIRDLLTPSVWRLGRNIRR